MILKKLFKGPIAVIRLTDRNKFDKVLNAVIEGGLRNIEITLTVPGAVEIIKELISTEKNDLVIGAGTVTTVKECEAVLEAGAQFVITPILNLDIITLTKNNNRISIPGCLTPTEILTAYKMGADIVKVFPATCFGPRYFKEILAPFPFLKLMPTGGVSIDNVEEWLSAGAATVAIGSDLIDKKLIEDGNYEAICQKTIKLITNFNETMNKLKIN